jgi:hypothetical protein
MKLTLKHILFHNWKEKLLCLAISFLIWTYIKNEIDPGIFDQLITGTITKNK